MKLLSNCIEADIKGIYLVDEKNKANELIRDSGLGWVETKEGAIDSDEFGELDRVLLVLLLNATEVVFDREAFPGAELLHLLQLLSTGCVILFSWLTI